MSARKTKPRASLPASLPPPSEVLPWHTAQWRQLLAQQRAGRVPHALLLRGPAGVGKVRFAFYLANSRLCSEADDQGRPCGHCRACAQFRSGSHPDFRLSEPQEGKRVIRVDQVRDLIDWVVQRPHYRGPKLLLFPTADLMNPAAANALLKTLEEPAGDTLIVLVTARPASLLATIRSRCQALTLNAPDGERALAWVQEQARVQGLDGGDPALALELCAGAPLSAVDALRDNLVEPFTAMFADIGALARGAKDPVAVAEQWRKQDVNRVVNWMLEGVQAMIRIKLSGSPGRLVTIRELAEGCSEKPLFDHLDRLTAALAQIQAGQNPNTQLLMESLFIPWQGTRR